MAYGLKASSCDPLILLLVSLHTCICFRTLHLTWGFDMTKFCTVLIWSMFQNGTLFRMAHNTNLKDVSGWHMFQNGTQCQSETCFRMAHVSERHTVPIWNMFQDGTCFRTARNTRTFPPGKASGCAWCIAAHNWPMLLQYVERLAFHIWKSNLMKKSITSRYKISERAC